MQYQIFADPYGGCAMRGLLPVVVVKVDGYNPFGVEKLEGHRRERYFRPRYRTVRVECYNSAGDESERLKHPRTVLSSSSFLEPRFCFFFPPFFLFLRIAGVEKVKYIYKRILSIY